MTTPRTGRQLGRRPAKTAPALMLRDILAVPAHPTVTDHLSRIQHWGLWGNDRYGTCGPVSFYNHVKVITTYLTGIEAEPVWEDVLNLYLLNNPDFDPVTGAGDNGVIMQTMLELAKRHDVLGGGRMVAFAKVDLSDRDEVRAAISIFGSVLLGVTLDLAQDAQTDRGLWDHARRSPVWGGHAVLAGSYTSDVRPAHADIDVITWALRIGTTDTFQAHQLDEAWVVILREHLAHPSFQQGIDLAALMAAYEALTGDPFPAVDPVPPPSADVEFSSFMAWLPGAWERFKGGEE